MRMELRLKINFNMEFCYEKKISINYFVQIYRFKKFPQEFFIKFILLKSH